MNDGGRVVAVEAPAPESGSVNRQAVVQLPLALPPRTPDPMAAPVLRWGVLGSGWIAERLRRLAAALHPPAAARGRLPRPGPRGGVRRPQSALRAPTVVRRARRRSRTSTWSTSRRPTPSTSPCARLALEAGKPCWSRSRSASTRRRPPRSRDVAAAQGLFCMEALWTFFLPKFDVVRQLLESAALGEVRTVLADMGEHFTADHRIMRPIWRAGRSWTWARTRSPSPRGCSARRAGSRRPGSRTGGRQRPAGARSSRTRTAARRCSTPPSSPTLPRRRPSPARRAR